MTTKRSRAIAKRPSYAMSFAGIGAIKPTRGRLELSVFTTFRDASTAAGLSQPMQGALQRLRGVSFCRSKVVISEDPAADPPSVTWTCYSENCLAGQICMIYGLVWVRPSEPTDVGHYEEIAIGKAPLDPLKAPPPTPGGWSYVYCRCG